MKICDLCPKDKAEAVAGFVILYPEDSQLDLCKTHIKHYKDFCSGTLEKKSDGKKPKA